MCADCSAAFRRSARHHAAESREASLPLPDQWVWSQIQQAAVVWNKQTQCYVTFIWLMLLSNAIYSKWIQPSKFNPKMHEHSKYINKDVYQMVAEEAFKSGTWVWIWVHLTTKSSSFGKWEHCVLYLGTDWQTVPGSTWKADLY